MLSVRASRFQAMVQPVATAGNSDELPALAAVRCGIDPSPVTNSVCSTVAGTGTGRRQRWYWHGVKPVSGTQRRHVGGSKVMHMQRK